MEKYQAYAEYKDSGVQWIGNIPKNWKFLRGKWKFKSLKEVNRDLQCMDRLALTMNGVIERSIDSDDGLQPAEFSGYQIFEKDDLVFKLIDLENFKTSRVGLVFKRGIMSPAYIRLKPFVGTDSKFFYYFYFDLYLRGVYNQIGGQGVRSALNATDLLEIEVCIPSLAEQKLIANFLDHEITKIDHLIEKQKQLIELLKEKCQAVISQAVTKGLDSNVPMKDSGVEWLGEVPEHWDTAPLKYLCELLKDGTHLPPARVDSGVPLLSVRNIINNKFTFRDDDSQISESSYADLCKSFIPQNGDVLLAIVGGTLGKVAVIEQMENFHIQRSLGIFRTKKTKLNNYFLAYLFSSKGFQSLLWENVGFSAQPGIYLGALSNFLIPVPSIEEQKNIIDFVKIQLDKFDNLINKALNSVQLMQERRTALISAAVTGKIDVRNWQAPTVAEAEMEFSA